MRIAEMLDEHRPVFSFEFFPPKTDDGQRTLEATLEVLKDDGPDYVSMTYGAGGSTRNATVELTRWIKQDLGIEAMAHLSCVGEPKERLVEILEQIEAAGVENVLALRGDPPRGQSEWQPHPGGLHYSVELIRLIREQLRLLRRRRLLPGDPSRRSRSRERPRLRARQAGGRRGLPDHPALLRQRAATSTSSRRRARSGISVPIIPGIMPITNYGQIKRFTEMCGASIPDELERAVDQARRRPGSGCGAWSRLRDSPVLRSPGARRARHPLLHPEPLTGNPGDPGRPARRASLDARAGAPSRPASAQRSGSASSSRPSPRRAARGGAGSRAPR